MSDTQKNVIVLLANGTEEMEFIIAVDILRRAGLNVKTVGVKLDKSFAVCSRQVRVAPDALLENETITTENYDAVIVPGGLEGANTLKNNDDVQKLIHEFHDKGKVVAFICAGTLVAKSAAIGEKKKHKVTSYPAVKGELDEYFEYSEDRVVVDENVITSRGPGTAFLFALTIVKKLCGKETSDKLKKEMLTADTL